MRKLQLAIAVVAATFGSVGLASAAPAMPAAGIVAPETGATSVRHMDMQDRMMHRRMMRKRMMRHRMMHHRGMHHRGMHTRGMHRM